MYCVIQGGEVIARFRDFYEAWVHVRMLARYSIISHPKEGYWIIQPPNSN